LGQCETPPARHSDVDIIEVLRMNTCYQVCMATMCRVLFKAARISAKTRRVLLL